MPSFLVILGPTIACTERIFSLTKGLFLRCLRVCPAPVVKGEGSSHFALGYYSCSSNQKAPAATRKRVKRQVL